MSSFPPGGPPPQQPPPPGSWPPPAGAYPPPPPGWYAGPFPPPGMGPQREGLWSMLLRSGLKTIVVTACLALGLIAAVFMAGACAAAITAAGGDGDPDDLDTAFFFGDRDSSRKLLSLEVDGVILGEDPGGVDLFGLAPAVTYGYTIKDQLRKAARDDDIAGVVLELSTPGGTVFGSQAIADGVAEYKQATGKPVIAFVRGLSASGGMWGMAPADRIYADNGSLVGSIGVIMGPFEYYDGVTATEGGILGGGITTRNGITSEYLTAGRGKDVGNPYRPMTDEERRVLQQGLDSLYAQFVRHVATHRQIPEQQIRDQLGALIYSNDDAQRLGLIDGTATREGAYAELARMASLEGNDWQVVRVESGTSFADIFAKGGGPPADAIAGARTARAAQLCFAPNTSLAYYGDPRALCPR